MDAAELVCIAIHIRGMKYSNIVVLCCHTLGETLEHGLKDVPQQAALLAHLAVVCSAHPADMEVQKQAKRLTHLLTPRAAPSGVASSPERAVLARVEELKASRDFESLVRDMDAFPELEELQQAGCDAIYDMLEQGGLWEEAAAAGAIERVVRALDLFQHSPETQLTTLDALFSLIATGASAWIAGNAGAVSLAVRALRSFPGDARVVCRAFYVLQHLALSHNKFREEALVGSNALVLCFSAVRRYPNDADLQGSALWCVAHLSGSDVVALADALSMGAMELTIAALRKHRAKNSTCTGAIACLRMLSYDEARAVHAKQLGAPALLQAAMKAHISDNELQKEAAAALARIQHFVDAASLRAEAIMAELIAGEEGAKGGTVAPKKAGKGKGKGKSSKEAVACPSALPPPQLLPPPPPPVAAGGEPALTKSQLKRRKAEVAAAARKAAAGEEEEERPDASSGDSDPLPRSRPPLDFSKDSEFRRRLKLPPRNVEAEIDEIIAQHEALFRQKSGVQTGAAGAAPLTSSHAPDVVETADAPPPEPAPASTAASSVPPRLRRIGRRCLLCSMSRRRSWPHIREEPTQRSRVSSETWPQCTARTRDWRGSWPRGMRPWRRFAKRSARYEQHKCKKQPDVEEKTTRSNTHFYQSMKIPARRVECVRASFIRGPSKTKEPAAR